MIKIFKLNNEQIEGSKKVKIALKRKIAFQMENLKGKILIKRVIIVCKKVKKIRERM